MFKNHHLENSNEFHELQYKPIAFSKPIFKHERIEREGKEEKANAFVTINASKGKSFENILLRKLNLELLKEYQLADRPKISVVIIIFLFKDDYDCSADCCSSYCANYCLHHIQKFREAVNFFESG